jgi:DNA polymerase-3 subunit delta
LLIGEPFQTAALARDLVKVLVPPEKRSFNFERYDGRTTPIAQILDSLRMPGLFRGRKLVWVKEPTLFLAGEKRSDLVSALFVACREERQTEAAERFLALAATAGWTQERFANADWASLSQTQAAEIFGRPLDPEERVELSSLRQYCADHNLGLSDYRDETGVLEDFLASDVLGDNVLLFTCAAVDRRKRIVKRIREIGAVAELTLERERSGALSAASVDQLIDGVLARERKRLAPAARQLLARRAGGDPAAFAMEIEKLCLYADSTELIGEDEVRVCCRDLAESWIFDFTRALAQRQGGEAVVLLRALLAQGEPPLRLIALIARELRMLLIARDCLVDTLAGKWNPRVPYTVFRDHLLPLLSESQREVLEGVHPYVLYLSFQNASRVTSSVLQRAVLRLQALDIKLKSSSASPLIALEAFVLDFCRGSERISEAARPRV